MTQPDRPRSVNIVGAGLIGGSIGLGLRKKGWHVSVVDVDSDVQKLGLDLGVADAEGLNPSADLTVVAVPVSKVVDLVKEALAATTGVVTDVGSTKAHICANISDPRFVGGHPMAGSEQDGIKGAKADMFESAMWVLTPGAETSKEAFSLLRQVASDLGAETLALTADVHDDLVAQVSHVPHIVAAALMSEADPEAGEHKALLRIAAGGFRDMTRVAAGRVSIWPDICVANSDAIVEHLKSLTLTLSELENLVASHDAEGLRTFFERARRARLNLPAGYDVSDQLCQMSIRIDNQPGQIATITTLAAELDVNILDLQIAHSGEGVEGVMRLVVGQAQVENYAERLSDLGYNATWREIQSDSGQDN